MKDNEVNITSEQAQASLDAVKKINTDAVKTQRPPVWLMTLLSAAYGMISFSYSSLGHDNLWMLGLIGSTTVFILLVLLLLYSYRLMGIKLKMLPTTSTSKRFNVLQAVFFAVVFGGSRALTALGFDWVAYVGGVISATGLFFLMYRYPTGEPAEKDLS
jgi:hypothetical protein